MRMDLKRLAGIILGFSAFQPLSANADQIYSTLSPSSPTYFSGEGWTVSGPTSNDPRFSSASLFTSPGNYSVGQIDLGLGYVSGTNSANVSLWTDSGGLPGSQLGSWAVSGQPVFGSDSDTLTTINGIAGVNLAAGVSYFLIVDPGSSNTWDAWYLDNTGTNGLLLQSSDGDATWSSYPNSTLGAFDILGTPGTPVSVPEPGSLVIIGAGLIGLAGLRRRRKGSRHGAQIRPRAKN